MDKMHACQECRFLHYHPRGNWPLMHWLQALVFSVIEILAALHIGGLLSLALWGLAALNIWRSIRTVYAVSRLAAANAFAPEVDA
jgi:hypothetical protein